MPLAAHQFENSTAMVAAISHDPLVSSQEQHVGCLLRAAAYTLVRLLGILWGGLLVRIQTLEHDASNEKPSLQCAEIHV